MISPVKGICVDCKEFSDEMGLKASVRWLSKKKPPLCNYHNILRKKKNKKRVSVKRTVLKPRRATGERQVFQAMWDKDEIKLSYVTGVPLHDQKDGRAYYFSHVLPKGKYPKFRLNPDNIVYMTLSEHGLWENWQFKIKADPALMSKWAHVFELQEKLLKQYHDAFDG